MKLIMIHGRAQEKEEELALKQRWIDTLNKGLAQSNLTLPADVIVEFPYYGKLLEKLVIDAKNGATRDIGDLSSNNGEEDFLKDFLVEVSENVDMTHEERAALDDSSDLSRGLLNSEFVQNFLAFLDRKRLFGDLTIKTFTRDVFLYLTLDNIKNELNNHVMKAFDEEPCVVVAHSMGTIVGYEILRNKPQYCIKNLITVGSPLGLRSIQKHLDTPLEMPECIQKGWFNAYDERDFVAINPLDEENFNITPGVENKNDVKNSTENRHGIEGYLSDPVVAKRIYEALVYE
jgi:hypothetical protein